MFLSDKGPTLETLDSLSISAVHQPFVSPHYLYAIIYVYFIKCRLIVAHLTVSTKADKAQLNTVRALHTTQMLV